MAGAKAAVQEQRVQPEQLARMVHTGSDVATYTMEAIEYRKLHQDEALRTGIPKLDACLKPALPGEIIVVLARPSMGKTSLMQFIARQMTKQLMQRQDPQHVVLYVSWETKVEQIGFYDLASATGVDASAAWYGAISDEDLAKLRVAAMRRAGMPLWVLGHSMKRRRQVQAFRVPDVRETALVMEDRWGVQPAAIFLDYLQRIDPLRYGEDRRETVMYNMDAACDLARDCGCPVFVGVQAGRKVDEREFKLPEMGDGQESSRIEQDADKVLSLWYPCKSVELGTLLKDIDREVTEDLFILGVKKQRFAESGQVVLLSFDPRRNTFVDYDYRRQKP